MLDALSRALRTSDNTLLLRSPVLLRMRPSSHVPPAASREPYRASSRSKRTPRRSSPKTAWNASSCVFVFLDLHAIPVPAAFMTPHIYPSMVTRGCAEVQRRGPIGGVIPVREDLSFGGSGMRTPENTYLLRASVNRDRLTAVLPSHMLASEYTARIDRGCNRAQDSASTIILSLPAKLIGRDLAGFRRTP
jgi:hypothetical protein